ACGADTATDKDSGLRMGHWLLHQPDIAGRSDASAAQRQGLSCRDPMSQSRLKGRQACATLAVRTSGNNSVVECDLAKVEVAGSNPVSRSNLRSLARASVGKL